ncbi:Prenylated carboxyl methyltransferase [Hyphodiscus hymeniophilus]|uniref:Protein-S-isoprenylcysteine O-methyltransferase n=1 Tax=Hyphodiscus hymeniophilus TaxID=353542 RepID=A0A9P6VFJ4_9HELO|nr:Prenylated carboxyl methyltransferase [Hyphodiscus hymeniophilus]
MDLSLPTLSLATAFLTAIYLIFRSYTPPNPAPPKAKQWKTDTLNSHHQSARKRYGLAILFSSCFYHVLLILFPPTFMSPFCPHPENLSSKLFTWSPYTAFCLILIGAAGPIRLLAYAQLGRDFTFQLARPRGLVKTGLYAYVRHPSYPALFGAHLVAAGLFMRWGGAVGCFGPGWLVRSTVFGVGTDVWALSVMGVMMFGLFGVRVMEEEDMLRSEFGAEYEEYAKRTKRFLPGII